MHYHFKIFKPYGMLSQLSSNDKHQVKKKRFLSELHSFPKSSMPIGRLDEKTEGLLLLTTDGKLSDTVNRSGIEKEYYAQLDGQITESALAALRNGVFIGIEGTKYKTKRCLVEKLIEPPLLPERPKKIRDDRHGPTSWVSITITEGKFRQVRKMTSAVGFPTLRLVRVRVDQLHINDMQPGEVIELESIL